jgi:hypothetical protein
MWIPDPIYRKLPLIYALAGLALPLSMGWSVPVGISAVLLISAGVMTALWRIPPHQKVALDQSTILRGQWEKRRARRIQSMNLDQR